MMFRVTDERLWYHEFLAGNAEELADNVRAGIVAYVSRDRDPSLTDLVPHEELHRRLEEIDRYLLERMNGDPQTLTDNLVAAWTLQAQLARRKAEAAFNPTLAVHVLEYTYFASSSQPQWLISSYRVGATQFSLPEYFQRVWKELSELQRMYGTSPDGITYGMAALSQYAAHCPLELPDFIRLEEAIQNGVAAMLWWYDVARQPRALQVGPEQFACEIRL